jgi:hypothetical protein
MELNSFFDFTTFRSVFTLFTRTVNVVYVGGPCCVRRADVEHGFLNSKWPACDTTDHCIRSSKNTWNFQRMFKAYETIVYITFFV